MGIAIIKKTYILVFTGTAEASDDSSLRGDMAFVTKLCLVCFCQYSVPAVEGLITIMYFTYFN